MASNSRHSLSSKEEASNKSDQNSSSSHKITTFFPVLRNEGRAKMGALKPTGLKQTEIINKLKNKESETSHNKVLDVKHSVGIGNKSELNLPTREKLRGNILSALKTPLSQVLRKNMEASETKKDSKVSKETEKINTTSNLQQEVSISSKSNKLDVKEGSVNEKLRGRAKKSLTENELAMPIRRSQKMTTSTPKLPSTNKPGPRKSTDNRNVTVSDKKKEFSEAIVSPPPIENADIAASNQSGMLKKTRKPKRHFRGGTYGLYLSKRKKRKILKSNEESKDDSNSLGGTENSSYLDTDEDDSLMSEDLYTASEKSLAEEDQNPDSQNFSMLKSSAQKQEKEKMEENRSKSMKHENFKKEKTKSNDKEEKPVQLNVSVESKNSQQSTSKIPGKVESMQLEDSKNLASKNKVLDSSDCKAKHELPDLCNLHSDKKVEDPSQIQFDKKILDSNNFQTENKSLEPNSMESEKLEVNELDSLKTENKFLDGDLVIENEHKDSTESKFSEACNMKLEDLISQSDNLDLKNMISQSNNLELENKNLQSHEVESENMILQISDLEPKNKCLQSSDLKVEHKFLESHNIELDSNFLDLSNISMENFESGKFEIDNFGSSNIEIETFESSNIEMENFEPSNVGIEKLESNSIEKEKLKSCSIEKIDMTGNNEIENVESSNVELENLDSSNVEMQNLESDNVEMEILESNNGELQNLDSNIIEMENLESNMENLESNNIENLESNNMEMENLDSDDIVIENVESVNTNSKNVKLNDFKLENLKSNSVESKINELALSESETKSIELKILESDNKFLDLNDTESENKYLESNDAESENNFFTASDFDFDNKCLKTKKSELDSKLASEFFEVPQFDDISNESFSNSKKSPSEMSDDKNEDIFSEATAELNANIMNDETINVSPMSESAKMEHFETSEPVNESGMSDQEDKPMDNSFKRSNDQDSEGIFSPCLSPDAKDDDGNSTIATCVKSRQRIKRRFTDDVVDTEMGLLAINQIPPPPPRKVPVVKPDPPKDVIETFEPITHSEAKKGPITTIELVFNSRQPPVMSCTCEGDTYEANLNFEEEGVFCQAVDSIDDKLVGCCNPVVTPRLVRSSVKIPFTIMCEMHLWRLKHHHSCPYCGVFCSQGTFMQCVTTKNKRKVIHLYHEQCQSKEEGIGVFCLHCGATSGLKFITLEMHMASPPAFVLNQLTREPLPHVAKARISISSAAERMKEEDIVDFSYKIEDTGRVLTSVGLKNGPEKDELEKLLEMMNQNRDIPNYHTHEEFYTASAEGDLLKVLNILARGIDPNLKFIDHEEDTALHAAAANGQTTVVHLLLQAGAINDSLNERTYTPLMLAVENNHKDVVFYLIKNGAFADFKGENGMSCFHMAAKNGNLEILKILMSSRNVDINAQDDGGWTPIVWASEHDHYEVVKYLLRRGANPNIKDSEGNTGLHWSAFSGSVDISYLYLDYGCDINATNERGDTPVHIAARQDSLSCVTLFLSRGADVQIRNKNNQLPAECVIDKTSDTYLSLSLNMLLKKIAGKYQHRAEKILHKDISRGKEQISIQCVNEVDDEPPPLDFLYVTENCETTPMNIDRTITSLQACQCEDDCSSSNCVCSSISYQCWYDKDGLLLPNFNLVDPPMLFECNRACSCWALSCRNRVLQNGITCRLQLVRTRGKGWGVRTLKDIPKGTFICEYVGEMISDSAADKRADDSYLFDLDNRDGETYCLDARYYGNISRFINHLCEPNLVPVKIYVDHQDLNFPRIAFFSSRDIKQYEELGFDYCEKFWVIKYKYFTCDCGSPKCKYSKDTIHHTLANYYRRVKEEQQLEEGAMQPPAPVAET